LSHPVLKALLMDIQNTTLFGFLDGHPYLEVRIW